MLSLKHIAVVKSAVVTSLHPELKREILCAPGSEYDVSKSGHLLSRKQQWNDIIGKKARELLSPLLPRDLLDGVVSLLPAVGLKMLLWAEYHEGTLGLTRDFSVQFLTYSHFTGRGVVDTRKAAEDLMDSENLKARQKYKIACIYFFSDRMNSLYEEVVRDGDGSAQFLQKPRVVRFWTSVLSGKHLRSKRTHYKQRITEAMASGCQPALQCMWQMWKGRKLNFVENAISVGERLLSMDRRSEDSDWIIFRDSRYDDAVDPPWVPTDYRDDIYRFLLSKVAEIPELEVRDLLHSLVYCIYLNNLNSVLELYLLWPHQDRFLEMATAMWDCMLGETFASVLLTICDRIEPRPGSRNIRHGEEECYDYRHLLREFWCRSPDRCKRDFFGSMDDLMHDVDAIDLDPSGRPAKYLLVKLLSLKKFTREDEDIIRSVLNCATHGEMTDLMSVTVWKDVFVEAMKVEKFEVFDRFLRVCFRSQAEAEEFRGKLKLEDEAHLVCESFLRSNKLNAIQSFMERISLTENELERLKFDLMDSPSGKARCWELISSEGIEALERFISWFLPSEKMARVFKRKLAARYCTTPRHSQRSIAPELMRHAQCCLGLPMVEKSSLWSPLCLQSDFRGEEVDAFVSSTLPPDERVDFKKRMCDEDAVRILGSLIDARRWSEADAFCEWLELPESEMSRLKKRTLSEPEGTWLTFHDLVFGDHGAKKSKQIDAMLRWHLTDTRAVIEFRDLFLRELECCNSEECLRAFEMSIEKYLGELSGQEREHSSLSVKRKSATSSPLKKAPQKPEEKKQKAKPVGTACLPRQEKKQVRRQSQRLLNRTNKK